MRNVERHLSVEIDRVRDLVLRPMVVAGGDARRSNRGARFSADDDVHEAARDDDEFLDGLAGNRLGDFRRGLGGGFDVGL